MRVMPSCSRTGWCLVGSVGVQEAVGEDLCRQVGHLVRRNPAEGAGFGIGGELTAEDVAAEGEGDDAAGHVLVDAGELVGLDVQAGFFLNLAAYAVVEGLAELEDAAGWFPSGRFPGAG
jgi:hypothetical protein